MACAAVHFVEGKSNLRMLQVSFFLSTTEITVPIFLGDRNFVDFVSQIVSLYRFFAMDPADIYRVIHESIRTLVGIIYECIMRIIYFEK